MRAIVSNLLPVRFLSRLIYGNFPLNWLTSLGLKFQVKMSDWIPFFFAKGATSESGIDTFFVPRELPDRLCEKREIHAFRNHESFPVSTLISALAVVKDEGSLNILFLAPASLLFGVLLIWSMKWLKFLVNSKLNLLVWFEDFLPFFLRGERSCEIMGAIIYSALDNNWKLKNKSKFPQRLIYSDKLADI